MILHFRHHLKTMKTQSVSTPGDIIFSFLPLKVTKYFLLERSLTKERCWLILILITLMELLVRPSVQFLAVYIFIKIFLFFYYLKPLFVKSSDKLIKSVKKGLLWRKTPPATSKRKESHSKKTEENEAIVEILDVTNEKIGHVRKMIRHFEEITENNNKRIEGIKLFRF